jgi:LmbE family N-acetylglucosaminyl deacetylase
MEARRHEDDAALAVLDAIPVHLEFVEHTYNPGDRPVAPEVLVEALAPALAALSPTTVLAPFGLANPDHDVTHRACMLARERLGDDMSWWCYEDSGYKHIPGMLAWRVSSLFRRGIWPTPVCPATAVDETLKRAAITCYPTQLLALEDDWAIKAKLAAPAPEQFWRLAPRAVPGWEGPRARLVEPLPFTSAQIRGLYDPGITSDEFGGPRLTTGGRRGRRPRPFQAGRRYFRHSLGMCVNVQMYSVRGQDRRACRNADSWLTVTSSRISPPS